MSFEPVKCVHCDRVLVDSSRTKKHDAIATHGGAMCNPKCDKAPPSLREQMAAQVAKANK